MASGGKTVSRRRAAPVAGSPSSGCRYSLQGRHTGSVCRMYLHPIDYKGLPCLLRAEHWRVRRCSGVMPEQQNEMQQGRDCRWQPLALPSSAT